MRGSARAHMLGLGLVLATGLACEIDGSIGRDGSTSTGPDDGSGTEASGSPTGGTADGTAGGGTAASVGEGSGGGSGEDTGTTDGPSDHPAVCQPTPDDEECARCRKEACCSLYEVCVAHEACLCWWDCVATGHTDMQCLEQCQDDGALYHELLTCVELHCDACLH